MYKGYKISDSDRWTESDATKFISWKLLALRYLQSGPPEVDSGARERAAQEVGVAPGVEPERRPPFDGHGARALL